MAFIDNGMSEKLKAQKDALLGITEAKEKTKEQFKAKEQVSDLFVETKSSDKFEVKELDRFNGLPPEIKLVVESLKITHNYPLEMILPAVLSTINFATCPLIDVHAPMFNEDYIMQTGIWTLGMAPSGKTKSSIYSIMNKPITDWQRKLSLAQADAEQTYEFELAVYKKNYKQIIDDKTLDDKDKQRAFINLGFEPQSPPGSCYIVPTATLNALIDTLNKVPFCAIRNDEGSEFFHGYAMKEDNLKQTVSTMSSLFTGSPIARLTGVKESNAEIHDRRFSMFFLTQPGNADFLNSAYLRRQGFLNRLLIANCPDFDLPPMNGKDRKLTKKAKEMLQPFYQMITELLNRQKIFHEGSALQLKPRVYEFDDDAYDLITAWADNLNIQAKKGGKLFKWQGFISRATEHATRLASGFTIINKKDSLDLNDVFLGMELFDWFLEQLINLDIDTPSAKNIEDVELREQFMEWFYGAHTGDTIKSINLKEGDIICPAGEERAMGWLTKAGGNWWRRNIDGTKRRAILQELVDQNRINDRKEMGANNKPQYFFSRIDDKESKSVSK